MFEERIEKAVEFFKSGYNCSQSVVLAFADMYGFTARNRRRVWQLPSVEVSSYASDLWRCMRYVSACWTGNRSD